MNIILVSGLATVLSCPVVLLWTNFFEHRRHLTLSDKTPELIIILPCVYFPYILASQHIYLYLSIKYIKNCKKTVVEMYKNKITAFGLECAKSIILLRTEKGYKFDKN